LKQIFAEALGGEGGEVGGPTDEPLNIEQIIAEQLTRYATNQALEELKCSIYYALTGETGTFETTPPQEDGESSSGDEIPSFADIFAEKLGKYVSKKELQQIFAEALGGEGGEEGGPTDEPLNIKQTIAEQLARYATNQALEELKGSIYYALTGEAGTFETTPPQGDGEPSSGDEIPSFADILAEKLGKYVSKKELRQIFAANSGEEPNPDDPPGELGEAIAKEINAMRDKLNNAQKKLKALEEFLDIPPDYIDDNLKANEGVISPIRKLQDRLSKIDAFTFAPTDYARDYVNGSLAQTGTTIGSLLGNLLSDRMGNIKENNGDPFVSVMGLHFTQKEINGFGHDGNIYGLAIGLDGIHKFNENFYVCYGVVGSYFQSKLDFYGIASGSGKDSRQTTSLTTLFGSCEWFNGKNLKRWLGGSLGGGYVHTKMHRRDDWGCSYLADFAGMQLHAQCEGAANILRKNGVQMGPWSSVYFSHIHQQGYEEISFAGNGVHSASIGAVDHNFLNFTIGVNVEKEMMNASRKTTHSHISGKIGWDCQILRNHSSALANIDGAGYKPYMPVFGYRNRNSMVVTIRHHYYMGRHWEFSTHWLGNFNGTYGANELSSSIAYNF
ncbi:MAG: autotransporter outer membrane beta-barrel domain-containing protein, partial [Puniceicoccales bacterium]|nr:autotransporter outer membrane beta-barrel domain-containing protein [Puniceicoccales bacterium]